MKTLPIAKTVNLPLLAEQLFAAFPAWMRPDPTGRSAGMTDVRIERDSVTFPDGTDESAVQAIIDAHNPAADSINQQFEKDNVAARDEFTNAPAWIKNLNYAAAEAYILSNTVGNVTKQQALTAVTNAANLNDIKNILANVINAVYGMVDIQQKLVRVILVCIFFVRKRL